MIFAYLDFNDIEPISAPDDLVLYSSPLNYFCDPAPSMVTMITCDNRRGYSTKNTTTCGEISIRLCLDNIQGTKRALWDGMSGTDLRLVPLQFSSLDVQPHLPSVSVILSSLNR